MIDLQYLYIKESKYICIISNLYLIGNINKGDIINVTKNDNYKAYYTNINYIHNNIQYNKITVDNKSFNKLFLELSKHRELTINKILEHESIS